MMFAQFVNCVFATRRRGLESSRFCLAGMKCQLRKFLARLAGCRMQNKIMLGVDPGVSGAIALVVGCDANTNKLKDLTERETWLIFDGIASAVDHAYIEKVGPGKGEGVRSVWTFSGSYHGLRMALIASGIPWEEVTPQKWQDAFGLKGKTAQEKRLIEQGKTSQANTSKKNRHKAKAEQLFPGIKITHAIADALLIAEYGRRVRTGQLTEAKR